MNDHEDAFDKSRVWSGLNVVDLKLKCLMILLAFCFEKTLNNGQSNSNHVII